LRASYRAIRPGYYTSKVHWNSIDLTSDEISEELLTSLITSSYQLVVSKLPKKVQASLLEK
uniref:MmcQ/YjbR family DNA-binding protein n=1 Tax=Streptococcus orisratti TaxID=114652 RepID=UPI0029420AD5